MTGREQTTGERVPETMLRRDFDALAGLVAEDVVLHSPITGTPDVIAGGDRGPGAVRLAPAPLAAATRAGNRLAGRVLRRRGA